MMLALIEAYGGDKWYVEPAGEQRQLFTGTEKECKAFIEGYKLGNRHGSNNKNF